MMTTINRVADSVEFRKFEDAYYNAMWNGENPIAEKWCTRCPLYTECHKEDSTLCYGCGLWEDMMGEDL